MRVASFLARKNRQVRYLWDLPYFILLFKITRKINMLFEPIFLSLDQLN